MLNIANFDNLWGQGIEEPFILVKNLKVSKEKVEVKEEKKHYSYVYGRAKMLMKRLILSGFFMLY